MNSLEPIVSQRPEVTLPPFVRMPESVIEGRLHNRSASVQDAMNVVEQPWHKTACVLYIAGRTYGEIAELLDLEQAIIGMAIRTPWCQEYIARILEEQSREPLELLKNAQIGVIQGMIDMFNDTKVSPTVRMGIGKDILDRTLGKPLQRVETSNAAPKSEDPVAEAERLEQESKRLRDSLQ